MRFFLLFLCLVSLSARAANPTTTRSVDTVADLKAVLVGNARESYNIRGYLSVNDGGQGLFEYDPASTVPDDGGINFAPTVGGGRWKRVVTGRDFYARWWGPTKTNLTLQTAVNWVSTNGWGKVIADGGDWLLKCDDSTRILIKSGVALETAEDSQLVCAPNPTNNWILVDAPFDSHDWRVTARLVGWNLAAPGGDTNKSGLIFSIQDTKNVTIGGCQASNWFTQYADIGSGNQNLQMFDQDWLPGGMAFGMRGDGVTDDRKNGQIYAKFCERYNTEFFLRSTTNGYLIGGSPGEDVSGGIWFTNRVPVRIRGEKTLIKSFYYNPTEGVLPHVSGAFVISSDNCTVSGFKIIQVGAFPPSETNTATTGFFVPIIIHNGTNTLVENCEFAPLQGKGISTSGSYTRVRDCFFDQCGITTGLGNYDDWLFYEATVPARGLGHSPIGVSVMNNTFFKGSPYKHCLLFSSADDIICTGNKLLEMDNPNPILAYTGDLGITDLKGTNIYRFSGTISHNTITGTNFGANAAITVRMNTTTNFTPSWFTPSNMYSAVIVSENHIFSSGPDLNDGIELIKGNQTKVINNEVTVTGSPFHPVGNCDGIIVRGNFLESTGGFGITIPFSEGFEAPPSFSDMVFEDNTITTPEGDEYAMRNIEPLFVRNLTVHNNKFIFRGAAGTGDAPKVIQLSAGEGFVDISGNKFYLTNAMSGRHVVTVIGTNTDVTFSHNDSYVLSGATVTRRGPVLNVRNAKVNFNNVGSLEFNDVINLELEGNFITSGDAYPYPLEMWTIGRAMIQNNTISNYFAGESFCAVIRATNSTFQGNTLIGTSASALAVNQFGKMYLGNNTIVNNGVGLTRVVASPPGTLSHIVYEQPLNVDAGDQPGLNGYPFSVHRNGGQATIAMTPDNWFTGSTRDWLYKIIPDNTNNNAGHAFFVHKTNGVDQFVFGAHGLNPPVFYVGDSTNPVFTFIGGLGTNTLLYLDNNRILQRVTLGANMTFVGGTLNSISGSGGGVTNDTPWNLDHDANQFSLTNAYRMRLRHNDSSNVEVTYTNTQGSASLGIGTAGQIELYNTATNTSTSAMFVYLNLARAWDFQTNFFGPSLAGKDLARASAPFDQGYFSATGINVGAPILRSGTGSPEGVVSADPGSMFLRTNTTPAAFFFKETGVSTTGWILYKPLATGAIPATIMVSCSDLTTAITAGTSKAYFRMPYTMTGVTVHGSLLTAQTSGSVFTFNVKENGTTIFSTKPTFDNTEKETKDAVTQPAVSDSTLTIRSEILIDVDQAGTSPAGLIVTFEGFR